MLISCLWSNATRRGLRTALALLLIAVACWGSVTARAQSTAFYVDGTLGNDGNNACSAPGAGACRTLTEALRRAQSGNSIHIAAGTYLADYVIARSVQIVADAPGVFLQGDQKGTVITVGAGIVVTLRGLTILDGRGTNGVGGGINNSGTLTVLNCAITRNQADNAGRGPGAGGDIYNAPAGALSMIGDTVSNGIAISGGGIYNDGTLTLANSTVRNNQAAFSGSGITNTGTLTAYNVTIHNNAGEYSGGAIENTGSLSLVDSTVSGNFAGKDGDGGAFENGPYHPEATATIVNTTIFSNTTRSNGSAIFNTDGASVSLINSTVVSNTVDLYASSGGAALYNVNGNLSVANSIVVDNTAPDCFGLLHGGNNLFRQADGCLTGPGDVLLAPGASALLAGLADNGGPTQTVRLLPGSPALGKGNVMLCQGPDVQGRDQRGDTRPLTLCDIGAYDTGRD